MSRLSSIGFYKNITTVTGQKTLSGYANQQLRDELSQNTPGRAAQISTITTMENYFDETDISQYRNEYKKY